MTESTQGALQLIGSMFFYVLCFVLPLGILAMIVHLVLSLPLRRRERARFFLDLLETSLNQGRSVEQTIVSIANSRDRAMGVRFHLLAAYLEDGLKLGEALKKVPRLLPPQISAMLRVGEKLGDLRRVLPACREALQEKPAGVQSATHYMLVLLLAFSPVAVFVMVVLMAMVVPRFNEVILGMTGVGGGPFLPEFILSHGNWLIGCQIFIGLVLMIAALIYTGGPCLTRWLQIFPLPVVDGIAWRVPWKRKRLQHIFSAMLATLLDGGVTEIEAVRLAGDCTANEVCRRRACRVMTALEQGTKLNDAVQAFDDTGEFHWRLTNACHARDGFLLALQGWHETLEAKAFQQEEAAAHVLTCGLVVLNGTIVALMAIALFGMLIAMIEAVTIW